MPIHIESNVVNGLHLHIDGSVNPEESQYVSFDHGMSFDSMFFPCTDTSSLSWLSEARCEIANKHFEDFDFGEMLVVDDGGWEIDDGLWRKTVFFENPKGGDSIKGRYHLEFAKDSTVVISESGK